MDCKTGTTVLHLIDTTGPGGAETVFIQLADLLRRQGYRSIVVIRGPGWVQQALEKRGLEPVIIDAKGSFAVGFLYKLARLAIKEKVDIIQSHLLGSNVYAALLGVLIRRPVVATYHGMVDVNPNERFRLLKNKAMQWGIKRYVAVSHSLAQQIKEQELLDPAKTEIIYNGVEVACYGKLTAPTTLRAELGLPSDAILVGSLGNVRPAKAYDVLIEAAATVATSRNKVHFVIAGHQKPSLMAQLTSQMKALAVTANIHFIGFVNDSASFLSQVDLFLLSSRSEGFSIATIEAMMTGLPVIVTRCGGPEEIVTHGTTGWMVEPGDPEALAAGIDKLIDDSELADRLASAGRNHALATFGTDAMIDGYLGIYRSLGGA
ncbi:MAG: glycosyltransferase family 4 protein [Cellvibrionaceae bacterium]